MSHSYLDSTHLELLPSHTSTVGRLAWLAALLGIGKGLIQRIGKLKIKQREGKLRAPIGPPKTSVVMTDVNLFRHGAAPALPVDCPDPAHAGPREGRPLSAQWLLHV